jgi:hypothetical protein
MCRLRRRNFPLHKEADSAEPVNFEYFNNQRHAPGRRQPRSELGMVRNFCLPLPQIRE